MKMLTSLSTIAILFIISLASPACEKAAAESCEQQDMNEVLNCGTEKNVEVCCVTGEPCVYKYNGIEYPDTDAGLNNLADALGCNYKSSDENNEQKQLIITQLIALRDRACAGAY